MSQKPKFIQITSSSTNIQAHNYAGVYAVDENGKKMPVEEGFWGKVW